ncbi:MAG: hypothetical protein GY891_09010 [Bacteroidetes bacterium]|nr:hypothetical protein [Bacteroidota bacterium]
MKELNTFRQFVNETKENVDELFGRKQDPTEKQAMMVFDTIEFMDDLVSAGHMDKAFFDVFTEKIGEAYSSLMMGASPELQSKMGFEVDVDLEENDAALDEVINEGIKSAAKQFVDFHVDGNDNEGVQQSTFSEKEYLEPGEYSKGTVEHFKELQNYLKKNKKYEYTSPGDVKFIFTLSGENIKIKG